jgi:hypothetical protein
MLRICHQGADLVIGHDDLLKYTGRKNIIAAALSYRVLKWMLPTLSPDRPPERRHLLFRLGFAGPGLIDCFEMATRAQSDGRLTVDPDGAPPEAPPAPSGRFYFEGTYRERGCSAFPLPGFFPPDFVQLVCLYQEGGGTRSEQAAYLAMKEDVAATILMAADNDLFSRWVWKRDQHQHDAGACVPATR